ncbi:tetraacyldisaccharide 4'-kinase [soil metagenome]
MSSSASGHGASARLQRAWGSRGLLARSLLPMAALYGGVTALRRALYRLGWLRTSRLPVPVIVVGNLLAGGAGKTPTVIAVVALLRRHGFTPGIVSRGYGRSGDDVVDVTPQLPATQAGDEPLLLRLRTGAPVVVGRDRAAAARELLQRHAQVDIIVSDDGLQHLALARDAQVLVFDERGAGNGWLLPAGPLREAVPADVPPRSVVLYNAVSPSTRLAGAMAQRSLAGAVGLQEWWRGDAVSMDVLGALRGRPLVAAAGLARPDRFFDMLRSAGLDFSALPLPDHHDFSTLPWPPATPDVIVTEKDAVKLDPAQLGETRVWVAALDFAPGVVFDAALMALLPGRPVTQASMFERGLTPAPPRK